MSTALLLAILTWLCPAFAAAAAAAGDGLAELAAVAAAKRGPGLKLNHQPATGDAGSSDVFLPGIKSSCK